MTLRVAAIQTCPIEGDREATYQKAETLLDDAAAKGVQLAVLPEGFFHGYSAVTDAKKHGDAAELERVLTSFESIPGPTTERMAAKAREHGMVIAFGMLVNGENGEKPSNASVLIDSTGEIVNVHRKVHLTPVIEAPDFKPGNDFAVSDTTIGCIGNMVCADFSLPETTRILAIRGAQIVCGSLAAFYGDNPERRLGVLQMYLNSHASPSRAIDNSLYLVMANMCGWNAGYEFFGRSRIIAPSGEILAEGDEGSDKEQIVVADIELGSVGELQFRLIERRRPDLYEAILTPNTNTAPLDFKG
jgi:predicted amidohydrolase